MEVPFEITVQELKEWRDTNKPHRLIDCREVWEYQLANIGGEHMPMNIIPGRIEELDPEEDIVVMCHAGVRSARVTHYLRNQGIDNARNLRGGIHAWSVEIDPTVPKY
jgi:rhodanese-related sulfurtransferase